MSATCCVSDVAGDFLEETQELDQLRGRAEDDVGRLAQAGRRLRGRNGDPDRDLAAIEPLEGVEVGRVVPGVEGAPEPVLVPPITENAPLVPIVWNPFEP